MQHGMDAKRIVCFLRESHPIVADTQAEFTGLTLQFPHISLTGLGEAMQRCENAHGRIAVEPSHVRAGRF
jgi:hypothetical protein